MDELLIDKFYTEVYKLLNEMCLTIVDFYYDETNFYFEIQDELDADKTIYKFSSPIGTNTEITEELISILVLVPLFDEIAPPAKNTEPIKLWSPDTSIDEAMRLIELTKIYNDYEKSWRHLELAPLKWDRDYIQPYGTPYITTQLNLPQPNVKQKPGTGSYIPGQWSFSNLTTC